MRYTFQTEQWLPHAPERVFAFFADPANLPRLMPAWQDAQIEDSHFVPPPPAPHPFPGSDRITAGTGTRLTLTVRAFPHAPIRLPWEALIEDFRWLHGFCDVQTRGPFTYWRHCHTIEPSTSPQGQPGTLVRDHIIYQPPLGPLGRLAHYLFLRLQLRRTFRYRQQRTLELLAKENGPQ
jgi:ligand-binding SRPBCC domain-containing protein